LDQDAIRAAETTLSNHVENELKLELQNYKKFENLNAENITPHFMSLVKSCHKSDCPTQICDDNGIPFSNKNSLKAHVSQYYKNIYSKGQVNDNPAMNNVEEFLGEDVLNRPEVQNAKLSEAEKLNLMLP
jgi:hypothetical protein